MKLLGSTKNKIIKDKNGENAPHLEITEVGLVHCNTVNNDYQQDLRVLYTFVPINRFVVYQKFREIELWFTDQNIQPLETEDKINLTLIIK